MVRPVCSLIFIFVFALTGCPNGNGSTIAARPGPIPLVVLHTNDTHGYIWGSDETGDAAQRANLIDELRRDVEARGGIVLLLDAGDVRTGTYCSDRQQAEPDLEIMEAMGYDAMVVGNHEFDEPFSVILEQRSLVDFPILGANVIAVETGEPLFDEVAFIERQGLRIAILGLVTADSATTSTRGADPALRFDSPIETAQRLVPQIRERADIVIALSHLGLDVDQELAGAVQGIDVIVGGHSHDVVEEPHRIGETVIVQAGSYARYVGRLELAVDGEAITLVGGRLVPVDREREPSASVSALLERFACQEANEVLIELAEPVTHEPLDGVGTSSLLSNLISDGFRAVTETDLAIVNRGGLRANLDAGGVTVADIHGVLPFDNNLVVLEARGEDLVGIARSVRARGRDGRGILFTSGMTFVFGPGEEVQVLIEGQPPDPERTYSIVMSAFIANGGDRHGPIGSLRRIRELEETSAAVFEAYLRERETVELDRQTRTRWIEAESPPLTEPAPKSLGFPRVSTNRCQTSVSATPE